MVPLMPYKIFHEDQALFSGLADDVLQEKVKASQPVCGQGMGIAVNLLLKFWSLITHPLLIRPLLYVDLTVHASDAYDRNSVQITCHFSTNMIRIFS